MKIQISDDYRITSDSMQWMVQKYDGMRTVRDGDGTQERWSTIGYYGTLDGAVRELHQRLVRVSDATTFADAMHIAQDALTGITRALSPQFKVVKK